MNTPKSDKPDVAIGFPTVQVGGKSWFSLGWVPWIAAIGGLGWIIVSWVDNTHYVTDLQDWRKNATIEILDIKKGITELSGRMDANSRVDERARWDVDQNAKLEADDRHNIDVEGEQLRSLDGRLRLLCEVVRNSNCVDGKR